MRSCFKGRSETIQRMGEYQQTFASLRFHRHKNWHHNNRGPMLSLSISISWQDLYHSGFKGKKGVAKVQVDEENTSLVHE